MGRGNLFCRVVAIPVYSFPVPLLKESAKVTKAERSGQCGWNRREKR
jgi:hypothetical protein